MPDDATYFLPVRDLAAKLRARSLTSEALTAGCLERLEQHGDRKSTRLNSSHT